MSSEQKLTTETQRTQRLHREEGYMTFSAKPCRRGWERFGLLAGAHAEINGAGFDCAEALELVLFLPCVLCHLFMAINFSQ